MLLPFFTLFWPKWEDKLNKHLDLESLNSDIDCVDMFMIKTTKFICKLALRHALTNSVNSKGCETLERLGKN